jgi:glycosyltransferase involved in cell wall biosynthesis
VRRTIFLQSKFPDDSLELLSLFERWSKYGETVQKHSDEDGVWLFSADFQQGQKAQQLKIQNIKFFKSVEGNVNTLRRVFALMHEIRQSRSKFTLVCGDNQKSLLIGIYLKLFNRSKVRIQTQFHGDTYTFRFNKGLRGIIRVCLSRIGIISSDSIRIVSTFQIEEIASFAPKSHQKFVLAPIPIDVSRIATPLSIKSIDLTFIGRLHQERGIVELIQIINVVKDAFPEISIVIAGDGPMRPLVEQQLSYWIDKGDVTMRGYLSGDQIHDLYSETKVLISTAPREGYGLTLREAALSQVLVIARQSKGACEAQNSYPEQIKTFSTFNEAFTLVQESLNQKINSAASGQIDAQMQLDSESLIRLINSWLDN